MMLDNTMQLTALLLGALALGGCDKVVSQSRTVCFTGYNEHDRAIHEVWLDSESKSGCFGNPPGREDGYPWGGGGKFSCGCQVTPGKEVKLEWTFVQSKEDFYAGVPAEEHSLKVKIPQPESSSSRYFRAYLRRDGSASLQWVDEMGAAELQPTIFKDGNEDE